MPYDISRNSWVNISIIYHRHDRKTVNYHTQSFVLCDIDESTGATIVGQRQNILEGKRSGFLYWSGLLEAGSYVLIPFSISFWFEDNKTRDFTVVIHSTEQFGLNVDHKPATFLADCLISAIVNNKDRANEVYTFFFYCKYSF